MKALWAFLLGCSVLTVMTRSEAPPRLFGGVLAGFVTFAQGARTIGPLSLPPASSDFSSSSQFGWSGIAGLEIPLSPTWSLAPTIGYSTARANLVADEATTFNVRGNPVPGLFRHNADLELSWAMLYASVIYHASQWVNVDVGGGVVIPLSGHVRATESIIEPTGITYVNGGTQRTTADVELGSDASLLPLMSMRYYFIPYKTEAVQVGIGAYANYVLGSFSSSAELRPFSAGLFMSFTVNLFSTKSRPVEYRSVARHDTVVVVDPYNPDVRNVRFVEIAKKVEFDTLDPLTGRVIVERTFVTVEKHLPSPPPFLSIVLRTRADTTTVPTTPRIIVNTDIVADEAIKSVQIYGIVNSDTIWTHQTTTLPVNELVWSFDQLPKRYDSESLFTIRIEAVATDKLNGRQRAAPAIITITRSLRKNER